MLERAFVEMDQIKSLLNTAIFNQNSILRLLEAEVFPNPFVNPIDNPFKDIDSLKPTSSLKSSERKRKTIEPFELKEAVNSSNSSPPPALELNPLNGKLQGQNDKAFIELEAPAMPKLRIAENSNSLTEDDEEEDNRQNDHEQGIKEDF